MIINRHRILYNKKKFKCEIRIVVFEIEKDISILCLYLRTK